MFAFICPGLGKPGKTLLRQCQICFFDSCCLMAIHQQTWIVGSIV